MPIFEWQARDALLDKSVFEDVRPYEYQPQAVFA